MTPQLALILCCGFIAWLFREDMRWRRIESPGLWIAGIWVAISGSRSPTYWTSYLGLGGQVESNLEGSPLNFLITVALIVAAFLTLQRRGFNWGFFVQGNKALFLIYFFFALSALWAEYPFVSLRRWFKDFGAIPVALILLTQTDPVAAIRTIYVRVSFLLFPFSILFYKYFPELGRTYSRDGEPLFAGVCSFKNELGQTLLVFGLILLWDLFELSKQEKSQIKKRQVMIHGGCLLMVAWLFVASDSKTSIVCFVLGLLFWRIGKYLARLSSPGKIVLSVFAVGLCLATFNAIFKPATAILEALGRDPSLTGRTDAWPIMIEASRSPLLGLGYRMFWDVAAGREVEEKTGFPYPSAHNGYLETYLAGGLVGLALLAVFLLATGLKITKALLEEGSFGRIGLIFFFVLLIYNWTESCLFWGGPPLWFTFLLFAIRPEQGLRASSDSRAVNSKQLSASLSR